MNQELLKNLKSAGMLSEQYVNLGQIPTGSYAFNRIISGKYNGGIPIGGFTEIKGESSTGKTIFLTHILAQAQRLGYYTGLADNEFSYEIEFSRKMGVDPSKLMYKSPDTVPGCFQWFEDVIKEIREKDTDTPIVFGLDSMAGASDEDMEKDVSDNTNMDGAIRAKSISNILKKFNPKLRKHKVAVILINQIRNKVGVMYGSPDTRAGGGKSLEFYCSCSFTVISNKSSDIQRDEHKSVIGIEGSIRNTKNKVSIPFEECDFNLSFANGLDPYFGVTKWLERDKYVEKAGAWYTVKECGTKFQSKDIAKVINDTGLKDIFT